MDLGLNLDLGTADFYSDLRGRFFRFPSCKRVMLVPSVLSVLSQATLEITGQVQTIAHPQSVSLSILCGRVLDTRMALGISRGPESLLFCCLLWPAYVPVQIIKELTFP